MSDLNNNTFYLTFKDIKPSWSLIGLSSIYGITALFGMFFNVYVIFVTIRTKSFRGTFNYLLALCSIFELFHESGHFLFVYTAFSGQNFIEYRLAAKIAFLSMFGIGAIFPAMFFTGIDRLIVIIFDDMQNNLKICLYLASMTLFCVLHGCFVCIIIVLYYGKFYGEQMITGCFADFFMYNPAFCNISFFFFTIMTCIIYLLVGIVIKYKSAGLPSADSIHYRVYRSLCCIIAVNNGGYLICVLFVALIKPLISSPINAWFWHVITGLILNIGAASNGPILYFTSTKYRQAFRDELPFLFKLRNINVIQVSPQQNGQTFAAAAGHRQRNNIG